AVRTLLGDGHRILVEVSPHPVLTVGMQAAIDEAGERAVAVGTLRRDEGGTGRFLTSLAEAFVRGARVDWSPLFAGAPRAALPTYPFQRERYWAAAPPAPRRDENTSAGWRYRAVWKPLTGLPAPSLH